MPIVPSGNPLEAAEERAREIIAAAEERAADIVRHAEALFHHGTEPEPEPENLRDTKVKPETEPAPEPVAEPAPEEVSEPTQVGP